MPALSGSVNLIGAKGAADPKGEVKCGDREGARRGKADDDGQDLIEYTILTTIIGIAGLLVLYTLPAKMGAAYTVGIRRGRTLGSRPCPLSAPCP